MFRSPRAYFVLLLSAGFAESQATPPEALAAQYTLTASTTYAFPTPSATADAGTFLVQDWGLSQGRVQRNPQNLAFVPDPFSPTPNASASVLSVTYPAGSYSHGTGGAQFFALFNGSESQQAMLLSYEIAFDQNFDFVKGGKLPGMRGGSSTVQCDGGDPSTGRNCFSTRLMWRPNGAGEVYAYIPDTNDLCERKDVMCSKGDFGISMNRGSFTLKSGEWQRLTMLVYMNSPTKTANGMIALYYNDELVLNQTQLQLRSGSSVTPGGLWFSTFFGGGDDSWATPEEQHTYFRNIRIWSSGTANSLDGPVVGTSAAPGARGPSPYLLVAAAGALAAHWLVLFPWA